jgi:hypothetical protein
MPDIRTPSDILTIAKLAQPLSFIGIANKQFLKGGDFDSRLPLMITAERLCCQWVYDTNSADSSLRASTNYLYGLLGPYGIEAQNMINNLSGTIPVVAGPSNQTVDVGEDAVFAITVTSSSSYSIAWFRNGVLIPGETGLSYTLSSAQLSDTGAIFNAVVTNATGSANSDNATLTVSSVITGSFFFGDDDYFAALSAGDDDIVYNGTFSITDGQPLVVNFTSGAQNNKFNGIKYPIGQGTKTLWENTPLNSGVVPDSVMRATITIGSYLYVISRVAMSLDSSNQTITYS